MAFTSALSTIGSKISGLSDGAIGALSGAIGYGLNALQSSANSTRASKEAKILMQIQDQYQRAFTHDQYGIMRKGLEDAGYNPLLALGSSTSYSQPSAMGVNADSDSGSQAVTSALDAYNGIRSTNAQIENIQADTNVKKFGQRGAIIKNLVDLANKYKNNPKVQKAVDAEIVKINPDFKHSAIDQYFYQNHPTTATVIRKLKQGDYRGAMYAIRARNKRIKSELNKQHSSISAMKSNSAITDLVAGTQHYKGEVFDVPLPEELRRHRGF